MHKEPLLAWEGAAGLRVVSVALASSNNPGLYRKLGQLQKLLLVIETLVDVAALIGYHRLHCLL